MQSMLAIAIDGGKGPASALKPVRVPRPAAGADELLIEVRAAGVNRPDILQRSGSYPPPAGAPETLGLEVAGVVAKAAGRWRVGDKLCALLGGGGYAEYAVCDPRHALPLPASIDMVQGAALPETVFTVYSNVVELGGLRSGQTLLVHGATSGIGVTAIQLAKALGARVIATSRGPGKAAMARELGADIAVDTTRQDFAQVAAQEGGVDVILNMVGGDYFPKDLEALKTGGRMVFIAALAGAEVKLPILQMMQKQAVITGSTLRRREAAEKARLAAEVERVVWPLIEAGRFKPRIDRTFAHAEAAAAHAHLERGAHVGKVVLVMQSAAGFASQTN